MMSSKDFEKKQIIFAFFKDGEKIAFSNDNIVIKDSDDKIKFQLSCYRLFAIFAVGNCSITSVLINNSKKFNFKIIIMNNSFRLIDIIGYQKDGNVLLKKKQYNYNSIILSKLIIVNKILNQIFLLNSLRNKTTKLKSDIELLYNYIDKVNESPDTYTIMAYEGNASKVFFNNYYGEFDWKGRKPRTRIDYINSILDLGYSILFNFIDSILSCFGFDTYVGILHKQFYMRKSLVCDIIEPFRCIVDKTVRKGINLKQFKVEDFILNKNEYLLKLTERPNYVNVLLKAILEYKDDIFIFVKYYYRCFMKGEEQLSMFLLDLKNDIN